MHKVALRPEHTSQEETSQPSSEEVRIAKEWSEESLKKIVPDIYRPNNECTDLLLHAFYK